MKTEISSLHFSTLDIDRIPNSSDTKLFDLIEQLESRVSDVTRIKVDSEFRYKTAFYTEIKSTNSVIAWIRSREPLPAVIRWRMNTVQGLAWYRETWRPKHDLLQQGPDFDKPLLADKVEIEVRACGCREHGYLISSRRLTLFWFLQR